MDKPLIWAEVDLNAYAHNIKELRRITHPNARLMAVVKANGYGHGACVVAREALQNGAEWLGVARINEAIQLRTEGFAAPILIFGYTPPDLADKLIEFDLTQTVYSYSTAEVLSSKAQSRGKTIRIHIKVDSGMGRLGLLPQVLVSPTASQDPKSDPVREIESIAKLTGLETEGIFTHFATADSADKSYANKQLDIFLEFLNRLRQAGLDPPIKHAANSSALIDLPESHLDLVRPGIATYGLYPSDEVNKKRVTLKPVMALKSRIIHLKQVPAGFNVSYGITYQTEKPTTIATVPVGYADGFNRLLSSRGDMLVHGQRVPIIGRVCMDLSMLDVRDLSNVNLEDEVVIFGQQGDESITADEIASRLNTINYEVVSTVMERVPRIYIKY
ncbi:MAG: alanine racemase [Desulfobacterales bacterium]|nr:MAG: alanine racemase [Desulfobacterales bacterium]